MNNAIYAVNPTTGASTLVATGTLDTVYAYDKIIVDPIGGYVYQYGIKNGVNSVQKINLTSGAVTILPTSITGSPMFGGFYNDDLIVALNNEIRAIDLTNGSSTVIAMGILDTVDAHDKFVVSPTGAAYQTGVKNGVAVLERVDLSTGASTVTPYNPSGTPNFAVAVAPEPSTMGLCVLGAGVGVYLLWRQRRVSR